MSYCVLSNVVIVSCQNCQLHVIDKLNLSQSMLIHWQSIKSCGLALKLQITLDHIRSQSDHFDDHSGKVYLVHPFPHKRFVTKGRLMIALVLFQLPFSVFIVLKLKGLDPPFLIGFLFAVMYLVLCILNFKLFHIAKTVRERAVVILGNLDGSGSVSRNVETKKVKVSLASLRKISTCLLAVVCYFVCSVPVIVRFGLISTDKRHLHDIIMKNWAQTFLALNSSVNCLIFFYKKNPCCVVMEKCF